MQFHYVVCSSQYVVHSMQYIVCSAQYVVHSRQYVVAQYLVCSRQYVVPSMLYISKNAYQILHTTYYILCTTHQILHTMYYILHTMYYILHSETTQYDYCIYHTRYQALPTRLPKSSTTLVMSLTILLADPKTSLNQRNEILNKCPHKRKFLLKSVPTNPQPPPILP